MGFDLAIPIFFLTVVEGLVAVMVSVAGYFIVNQIYRAVNSLVAYLQTKQAPETAEQKPFPYQAVHIA